jgi:hypothetical protein
LVPEEDAHLL